MVSDVEHLVFVYFRKLRSASFWSLTSVWSCRNILWYNFSWLWISHPTKSSSLSRQLSPFSSWTLISRGKSMSSTPSIWLHYVEDLKLFQSCFPKRKKTKYGQHYHLENEFSTKNDTCTWFILWRLMTKKLLSSNE